jgi:hypothetical protein
MTNLHARINQVQTDLHALRNQVRTDLRIELRGLKRVSTAFSQKEFLLTFS